MTLPISALPKQEEHEAPAIGSLRASCLSYSEVLAQSVSVIAPSTVPAAVIGLIFARAGNGTWLSFLFGMLGLLFVSQNINQFARRSASPGSLYSYTVRGLGPTAGVLGGWALLFGYLLTGMSTLCGFALIANTISTRLWGIQIPVLGLFGAGAVLSFYIAYKDIQLSAKAMLAFEGFAILLVLFLGGLIWRSKGFAVDHAQFTLEGASPGSVLGGVVLVVFGFSGFESSTALGDEAKNPLKAIPRSVLQSVVLTGLFFVAMAYLVVLGFRGSGLDLARSESPLTTLAESLGWGNLGMVLNVGVLLSFLSCTLASINSTARILYSMAHHGLLSDALGNAHAQNQTPHVAVAVSSGLTFAVPGLLYASGVDAFDAQGHFGTLCSFGFIVAYILISVAAPRYLRSIGRLTPWAVAYAVGGVAFMAVPVLGAVGIPGSALFPVPDETGLVLLAVFVTYMGAALGWLALQRTRKPRMLLQMERAIESVHRRFAEVGGQALTPISSERSSPPSGGFGGGG